MRRNHGRVGAAQAPHDIRQALYRLTPWDGLHGGDLSESPPLDLGNLRIHGSLEETQQALGAVVAAVLERGAVPVVLGGGHETAYGHYLGYVAGRRSVGIINLDAHLDVRPWPDGHGHSGSPFRQALEHPEQPLPGKQYVCLGAQPHSVSRAHWQYAQEKGCVVYWCGQLQPSLQAVLGKELARLQKANCQVYVSVDADVVRLADMPGVSAPNPLGLPGREVSEAARLVGQSPAVASLDVVEVNPRYDIDNHSSRLAALVVWHFLMGLAARSRSG